VYSLLVPGEWGFGDSRPVGRYSVVSIAKERCTNRLSQRPLAILARVFADVGAIRKT